MRSLVERFGLGAGAAEEKWANWADAPAPAVPVRSRAGRCKLQGSRVIHKKGWFVVGQREGGWAQERATTPSSPRYNGPLPVQPGCTSSKPCTHSNCASGLC